MDENTIQFDTKQEYCNYAENECDNCILQCKCLEMFPENIEE